MHITNIDIHFNAVNSTWYATCSMYENGYTVQVTGTGTTVSSAKKSMFKNACTIEVRSAIK